MSDDLIISGAGTVAVASDELLTHSRLLSEWSHEARSAAVRVGGIDAMLGSSAMRSADVPVSALRAEEAIDRSRALLDAVGSETTKLSRGLMIAAENYGRVELFNARMVQDIAGALGYGLAYLTPLLLVFALPAIGAAGGAALLGNAMAGRSTAQLTALLGEWLRNNSSLLTNPTTVALVRAAVMSSDDYIAGVLRLPGPLAHALGDSGVGLTGLNTSAAIVAALGGRALFAESGVRVAATGQAPVITAPHGFADRVDRVPDVPLRDDGAQIRIERYDMPNGEARFEVYIAGTVDFSPVADDEPWDMTSNVHGVAGLPAGSYNAVREAMADAGVTGSSPVAFTGYSQGGLVASLLASTGEYNTHGLFTVGAPAGQVELPSGFPVVAVEHTDDIVPATGGTQINAGVVLVQRELFGGRDVPTDFAVPAHQLDQYRETVALLDDAGSEAVLDAVARLDSFTSGSTTMTSTTYRAERVPD